MATPSSSASSALPSGISAPPETITDNDKGALIAILAGFSLSLVLVSIPIRTYARSKIGRYKADDYAFLAASVFSIFQAAAVFYALRRGLGKSEDLIDSQDILPLQKAAYTSDILYIIVLFLSKCSTAFLFLRLTPNRGHSLAMWGTISMSIAWAVVSIFLVALRCHPAHPWTDVTVSECSGLFARWQFVTALDVITEVALFGISVYLVWGIQMALKSKCTVLGAFACRLPVIVIAGLRLYFLNMEINSSDPTLSASNVVSCTQLEIGYGIMASIAPCLRAFISAYEPNLADNTKYPHSGYGHSTSHKLSSLASNSRNEGAAESEPSAEDDRERLGRFANNFKGKLRPEKSTYEAQVVTAQQRDGVGHRLSGDSANSRRLIIIKKAVEWTVDYGNRNPSPGSKEDDQLTIEEVHASRER